MIQVKAVLFSRPVYLFLLTLIFVALGIGLRGPWPADEPRFALMALTMLDSDQWLFPTRGIEFYADKPPLFMWVQAIFIKLTGSLNVGFLIPALLSALVIVMLTHDLIKRVWGQDAAWLGALLLLCIPQFVIIGRSGQIDPVLCLWVCIGFYGLMRFSVIDGSKGWLYLGFFAMGLGVITKGVGFLPLLMIPIILIASRMDFTHIIRAPRGWLHFSLGIFVFLTPIMLWLLAMLNAVEQSGNPALEAYRDNILFKQTGERYVSPSGHIKPWWYFFVEVIPIFWLPVFLMLPLVIPKWLNAVKLRDARIFLPMSWMLLVLIFFSLSPGKRGIYIAPLIPAAVFLCAPYLRDILNSQRARTFTWILIMIMALIVSVLGAILQFEWHSKSLEVVYKLQSNPGWILLIIGLGGILIALLLGRKHGFISFMAFFGLMWSVYGLIIYPTFDSVRSGKSLMMALEDAVPSTTQVGLVDWKEQQLLHAQRQVVEFGATRSIEQQVASGIDWVQGADDRILFIQDRDIEPCFDIEKLQFVEHAHRRDWYLATIDSVVATCLK